MVLAASLVSTDSHRLSCCWSLCYYKYSVGGNFKLWSYCRDDTLYVLLSCSKNFNGKIAAGIQKRNIVTLYFYSYLVSHLITLSLTVISLHITDLVF